MDPINENANNNVVMGSGAPVPNVTPGSNAAPVPPSPVSPAPTVAPPSSDPSVMAPPSEPAKKKIGLWIGLGVGALAVIGAIVAVILIPQLSQPNYIEMAKSIDNLYGDLSDFFYNSGCSNVEMYVTSTYSVSTETYNSYIEQCKSDAKTLNDAIKKFESESGITRDSEINDKFKAFKAVYELNAPGIDKLEDTLKVYDALHDFAVAVNDAKIYDSDADELISVEDFSKIADYLTNSGNESIKTFGEGLKQRYATLYDLGQKYIQAENDYSNYEASSAAWNDFWDAYDEFTDYLREYDDLFEELDIRLADTDDHGEGSVFNTLDEVYDAILKKTH